MSIAKHWGIDFLFITTLAVTGLAGCTDDTGTVDDLSDSEYDRTVEGLSNSQHARSSLLVLSEKIGDVGREAISIGLPAVKGRQLDAGEDGILYVDVDSVPKSAFRAVFDMVHAGLQRGRSVVVETSEFDFDRMHEVVASEFPMIDRSTIEDVAVLLRPEAGTIKALRVDPSELAIYGGVEFKDTTAGRVDSLVQEMVRSYGSAAASANATTSTNALGAGYYDPINFAIQAYDSNPGTQGNWELRYNGTYVDVWKTPGASVNPSCYVAWRGTDPTNPSDDWADISSQFRQIANIDNAENNTVLKGGRGFVNRLHAYDNIVNKRLKDLNCSNVSITGHSLGGAVSQLHGIQLAFDPYWKSRLLIVDAWNSPNVVNTATRAVVVARFNILGNLWSVNNRRNDMIVNSVPTGLVRLGPANSAYVAGCTHVSPQRSSNGFSNHSLAFWLDELE